MRLNRKEIENYLIEAQVIEKALLNSAEEKKQYIENINCPSLEEIKQKINRITTQENICNPVKWQAVPKYRKQLDNSLDDSGKERKAEQWFNEKWNSESWRMRNCPGKDVLKQIRSWCQKEYHLTVTDNKLVEALDELPNDLKEIMNQLQQYFYESSKS